MAMWNDPTAADPSRYPAEYYKQSVREYGQTYGGDTTSYIGGSGLGFGLAGDGSRSRPQRTIAEKMGKYYIQTGRTFGWVGTAYPDHPAYTSQVGAPIYTKPVAKPLTASPTKKEGEA